MATMPARQISDGKLRQRERILKSRDFRTVYKNGQSVKSGPLVLCYFPNSLTCNRLGFSISSRNTKLAFCRNRARRLFREVYRLHKDEIRKHFDIVLVVKRALPDSMRYSGAEELFMRLIKNAGILS